LDEDPNDNHPEERTSAHIEEVIDKDLDPPDDSGPDEPPQDKGKGHAESEHPNNNPPNNGDGLTVPAAPTMTPPMVPRLIETLQLLVQFARGSLVFLQVLMTTRRQPGPLTLNPSMAPTLRPSMPSLQPVPLHSLAGLRLTRNNAHVLLMPLVSSEVQPETTLLRSSVRPTIPELYLRYSKIGPSSRQNSLGISDLSI